MMSFLDISFPSNFEYSSDSESLPLDFYLQTFPKSKIVYLKLGYFSSSAIRVLAYGFAQFIYHGGKIKIVTNHFLYGEDKILLDDKNFSSVDMCEDVLANLELIKNSLTGESEHFFNCLRYLIKTKRVEIIPVMLFPNRMSHYKQGVFIDNCSNTIFVEGSCNFTANGLLENGESISVYRSWGDSFEKNKIEGKVSSIKNICKKNDDQYIYINSDKIIDAMSSLGIEKSIEELLYNESNLVGELRVSTNSKILERHKKELEEILLKEKNEPKFPFSSGPRKYQKVAYNNWKRNGFKGAFSMATGTGKTITSLNCLLNVYRELGQYQAVILVPGKTLLKQWMNEVSLFNFKNVISVSSEFNKWETQLNELSTSLLFNKSKSYIIISTYSSFTNDKFQKHFKQLPKNSLFIADEAHNLGSPKVKKIIEDLHIEKRIALSATLTRQFDDEGNKFIEEVFDSPPPYTYDFSMRRAIDEGVLCQYDYFPHFVYLNDDELERYVEISKKLLKLFDFDKGVFRNPKAVQMLLIKRKRIIHKAESKLNVFKNILIKHFETYSSISNSFVYAPEGDSDDERNILDMFLNEYELLFPNNRAYAYTSETENREKVISLFESGFVDTLFSMKCLDEGVDVPRTELAIFCSSTGNPRQFIQRRGRVLRTHPDKDRAIIHDMIVIPSVTPNEDTLAIERKLFKDELTRVVYFASLARNYYSIMTKFEDVAALYDIDIYEIQTELEDKQ
jgi:superfamily II DNA or RNA helicase